MPLVLDASAALAWCYPDEADAPVADLIAAIRREGAFVPAHFVVEVANALALGLKRARLTADQAEAFARALAALKITVVDPAEIGEAGALAGDARSGGLTAYDAAYLALARARRSPLATLDRELAAAAQAQGVSLWSAP